MLISQIEFEKNSTLKQISNKVEYISACSIWNDTGYPIELEPNFPSSDKIVKKLKIDFDEKKDLLIEWGFDKMDFSSGILENLKGNVFVEKSPSERIEYYNLDISNFGSRIKVPDSKSNLELLCSISNQNNKKIVRISSPYIISNDLSIDILVQFEDSEGLSIVPIPAKDSKGVPIDKLKSKISIHSCSGLEENPMQYDLKSIERTKEKEITFEGYFACLKYSKIGCYNRISIEPLVIIKNALPFRIVIHLGKPGVEPSK